MKYIKTYESFRCVINEEWFWNKDEYEKGNLSDYFADPNKDDSPVLDFVLSYQVEKIKGEVEAEDDPYISIGKEQNVWYLRYDIIVTNTPLAKWFVKSSKNEIRPFSGHEFSVQMRLPLDKMNELISSYKSKKINKIELIKRLEDLTNNSDKKFGIRIVDGKVRQLEKIIKTNPDSLKEIGLYTMIGHKLDDSVFNDIDWDNIETEKNDKVDNSVKSIVDDLIKSFKGDYDGTDEESALKIIKRIKSKNEIAQINNLLISKGKPNLKDYINSEMSDIDQKEYRAIWDHLSKFGVTGANFNELLATIGKGIDAIESFLKKFNENLESISLKMYELGVKSASIVEKFIKWILDKIKNFKEKHPTLYRTIIITIVLLVILFVLTSAAASGGKPSPETINKAIGLLEICKDKSVEKMDVEHSSIYSEAMVYLINLRDGKSVSGFSQMALKAANLALSAIEQKKLGSNELTEGELLSWAEKGTKYVAGKIISSGHYEFTVDDPEFFQPK